MIDFTAENSVGRLFCIATDISTREAGKSVARWLAAGEKLKATNRWHAFVAAVCCADPDLGGVVTLETLRAAVLVCRYHYTLRLWDPKDPTSGAIWRRMLLEDGTIPKAWKEGNTTPEAFARRLAWPVIDGAIVPPKVTPSNGATGQDRLDVDAPAPKMTADDIFCRGCSGGPIDSGVLDDLIRDWANGDFRRGVADSGEIVDDAEIGRRTKNEWMAAILLASGWPRPADVSLSVCGVAAGALYKDAGKLPVRSPDDLSLVINGVAPEAWRALGETEWTAAIDVAGADRVHADEGSALQNTAAQRSDAGGRRDSRERPAKTDARGGVADHRPGSDTPPSESRSVVTMEALGALAVGGSVKIQGALPNNSVLIDDCTGHGYATGPDIPLHFDGKQSIRCDPCSGCGYLECQCGTNEETAANVTAECQQLPAAVTRIEFVTVSQALQVLGLEKASDHWTTDAADGVLHVSHIGTLQKCGMQYLYRYVEGLKRPPGLALIEGTSAHVAVERDLTNKIESGELLESDAIAAHAADAHDQRLDEEGFWLPPDERDRNASAVVGQSKDRTVEMALCHHTEIAPGVNPVHVERRFRIKVGGVKIAGTIDAQEPNVIRDWKFTGRSKRQADVDNSLQLTTYGLAARIVDGAAPDRFEINAVVRTKASSKSRAQRLVSTRGDADYKRAVRVARAAQAVIQGGRFMPCNPEHWTCGEKWCGYFDSVCPYGRRGRSRPGVIK